MTEQDPKQQTTESGQQEPTPAKQAEAAGELSDEQLDRVAGGKIIIDVEKVYLLTCCQVRGWGAPAEGPLALRAQHAG